MQIKRLKLTNFGLHSNVEIDNTDNDSVIGLIGTNGCGKSTIVQAIQYAFTNKAGDDSIDTFIKAGESQMIVEVMFEKDDKIGFITRSVRRNNKKGGTVTHRSLKWADEPELTKAKEVDEKIEEILGVDLQSLLNTIFISQGEITNMLNSTTSSRIDIVSKLLNLHYTNKNTKQIENALDNLKKSVTDLNPLKDNLSEKERDYNDRLLKLNESKLNTETEYGDEEFVKNLNSLIRDYLKVSADYAKFINLNQNVEDEHKRLNDTLEEVKSANNNEDVNALINSLKESIEVYNNDKTKIHNKIMGIKDGIFMLNEIESINTKIEKLETVRHERFDDKSYTEIVEFISEYKPKIELYNTHKEELEIYNTSVKQVVETVDKLNRRNIYANEVKLNIERYNENINITNNSIQHLNTLKDAKLKLKSKVNKDTTTCPTCGLKLMLGQEICDGDITSVDNGIEFLTKNLNEYKDKLATATSEHAGALAAANHYMIENDRHLTLIKNYEKKWDDATKNTLLSDDEFKEVNDLLKKYTYGASVADYAYLTNNNKAYEDKRRTLIMALDANLYITHLNDYMYHDNAVVYTCKDSAETKLKIAETEELFKIIEDITIMSNTLNKVTKLYNDVENHKNFYESYKKNRESLEKAVNEHEFKKFITVAKHYAYNYFNIEDVLNTTNDVLKCYESYRLESNTLNALKECIDRESTRIEKLVNDNIDQYRKLEEVTYIKQLLTPKSGITKDYLNYLFNIISNYVSEYLVYLNSNFIIKVEDRDSEDDLSFQFLRVDKEENGWLPMSKLSGGEKIRLSVAFLLAIQKIICPDVCFLVLDEPSTHLDTDGVKALGKLIEELGDMLDNQKGQVWIIDHNTSLQQHLTKCINI